jgi:hypothetical protein
VVDEDDPGQFRFSDETLAWRERSVTAEQIVTARERSFRSFGSCSFEEPCGDLKRLGLLQSMKSFSREA